MSVQSKIAWREFRMRPSRPLLTLLSVVIGVAAVVAVSISAQTSRRAFDAIFSAVTGKSDLEVTAPVGSSFDEKVADEIRKIPGVAAVAPQIERMTLLYVGKKNVQVVALGIDPKEDKAVHDYELKEGKSLLEVNGVMLDAGFAESQGLKVGDGIKLLTRIGTRPTHVVGIFTQGSGATTSEGVALLLPLKAAQILFKTPDKVDTAQIVLKPGANEKAVQAEIAKLLPTGVSVGRPAARTAMAEETSLSTEQGMRMGRAFSLLVAAFIIANTFLINIAQRRKQIGIMRAIGATRKQVIGMVYRDALRMGLLGTILGSLLGIFMARYLNQAMGTLYQTKLPSVELSWTPFLIAVGCGLGVSLLAAAYPAHKASNLSPLEAMRDVLPEEVEGTSWGLLATGAISAFIFLVVMAASILGWLPAFNAVWAGGLLLCSLALMLPAVLRPLSSAAATLLRPFAGIEARLAQLQLLRHRSRTTLTVSVMFFAIAAGIGLASAVIDNVNNVRDWYHKAFVADFYVRAMAPSMATGLAADLPDTIGPQLQKVDGIKSLDAIRIVSVKAGGERAVIMATDHTGSGALDLDIVTGDSAKLRDQLKKGEVAVGSVLAARAKLKIGDNVALDTDQGPKKFRIAAIVNEYRAGGLVIHMERDVARRELNVDGVDGYIVKADPAKLPQIHEQLQTITKESGLILESFAGIQKKIDTMMSGVVAALWGMVVVMLCVAAVGVTNTLTINVLEQTREIGLLRVIAMTRSQVRKTVITQAMIMAILALLPGVLAGVGIAFLVNLATYPVTGHFVRFTLHPELLLGGVAAGVVVMVIAAMLPADRAARLHLPTALHMS